MIYVALVATTFDRGSVVSKVLEIISATPREYLHTPEYIQEDLHGETFQQTVRFFSPRLQFRPAALFTPHLKAMNPLPCGLPLPLSTFGFEDLVQ